MDKYKKAELQWKNGKIAKPPVQPGVDVDLRERAEAKPDEIARRSPQVHHQEAAKLAKEIEQDEFLAKITNRERSTVNFDFWRTRARAEQTADCLAARKAIYDGDQAFAKGDLIRARPKYDEGLRGWRKVLDDPEFQLLIDDVSLGSDLIDVIRRYQKCLDQDDLDLPDPFILQDVIDKWGDRQGDPLPHILRKKAKTPPATAEKPDKQGKPAAKGSSEPK